MQVSTPDVRRNWVKCERFEDVVDPNEHLQNIQHLARANIVTHKWDFKFVFGAYLGGKRIDRYLDFDEAQPITPWEEFTKGFLRKFW